MATLFSTWVPRSDKIARMTKRQLGSDNSVVFFGISMAIQRLHKEFSTWFQTDKKIVIEEYETFVQDFFKVDNVDSSHISQLHDLGYLPIRILHLPEGTVTKTGVVQLVIYNTHPDFAWLTNYLETPLSALLWKAQTSASIARNYRKTAEWWAEKTCDNNLHVDWQMHDFSMRGLVLDDAEMSCMGHLLYFNGTDVLPAVFAADRYYLGVDRTQFGSVPASEHSVMCAGGKETELDTYARIIDTYPTGIVSIVSDTWDLWQVITDTLPKLKSKIMERNGKVVIRPDSGDPADILCGDPEALEDSPAYKGVIQLLWEIFGGVTNAKGYKELDSHIGAIYGDSITLDRAEEIFSRLEKKGFASNNVVLGIGSFTYQCNTRDQWGFAMKATGAIINGEEVALFKDPVTDDGTKKSFKGFLTTKKMEDCSYRTFDGLTFKEATMSLDSAFVVGFDDEQAKRRAPFWHDVVDLARIGI